MSLVSNKVLDIERFVADEMSGPQRLTAYTVAGGLPDATVFPRCMIYVSDESGGSTPAFSDGTNWRRTSDRAIVT